MQEQIIHIHSKFYSKIQWMIFSSAFRFVIPIFFLGENYHHWKKIVDQEAICSPGLQAHE